MPSSSASAPKLPDFRKSPLWQAKSSRRRRYWFADGAWLNQGQLGAPVSFALTQWCADRVLVGADFDERFALNLHRQLNRAAKQPEDADLGEFPEHGVQALRDGGWVRLGYRCRGRDAIVTALMNYGPVLGLWQWYQSMYHQRVVEGRTVLVVDLQSTLMGGHAALLDAVDLDLEIGGVRGFARVKNTWGREWADGGHCLISLADLEKVASEAVLVLPDPRALRPGVDPDVAIDADPTATPDGAATDLPDESRYEPQGIGSDRWTTRDLIGYAAHAEAITRAITHPDTSAPLTVGITGPWGAGKTSLMRMVRQRLEWPTGGLDGGESARAPRGIALLPSKEARPTRRTRSAARSASAAGRSAVQNPVGLDATDRDESSTGTVTIAALLRSLRSRPAPETLDARPLVSPAHAKDEEQRWRPTVWFNPWMYQTGEQVWAGLAHEIIAQVTARMSVVDRERFWLQLNLKRVDERAVRRRIYGLVASRLVPWVVGGIVLLVAGLLAALLGLPGAIGGAAAIAGPLVIVGATIIKSRAVLSAKTKDLLADLLSPDSLGDLVRSPRYEQETGQLFLVRTDVGRVLDLVATPTRPLVIFVDDLDRCNPSTVVQVIEAINLFVAGDYPNTMFVLALEPAMVVAQIEAAYGELTKRLASDASGRSGAELGWYFLEKIVQLPFPLPSVDAERVRGYVGGLLGGAVAGSPAQPDEVSIRLAEAELSEATSVAETLDRVASPLAAPVPQAALIEAARRVISRRLSTESPAVQSAVDYAIPRLGGNPREIKRFVNVFRFFVMISSERQLTEAGAALPLPALAKLAILLVRWPGHVSTLTRRVQQNGTSQTVITVVESSDGIDDARSTLTPLLSEAAAVAVTQRELYDLICGVPFVGELTDGFL